MKYLVNKETKEHVIYVPWLMNSQWTLVEADSEGWIKHEGKVCPLPDGVRCDIIEGKWTSPDARPAKNWSWGSALRYRPILTEQAEPVKASDHGEHDTMQDAMRAISPEYDKACDDFESELSDFIMGSNELKAPTTTRAQCRLTYSTDSKQHTNTHSRYPTLKRNCGKCLSMGYDLVSRNPFAQQRHGTGG
jgi:hypothetical protein